ncbi:aminotransferase class I/II-fold pyridoxal phosphate-dependent enzyme (plasmid) [Rhizobium pusense]|uniref:Aminotransferase class I/II-fold pyridoxal phosphate-dependent enzyme n=2 Tax=Agrobacterium pusense TaxID=648995 RepID=A0AA44IYB4_9HYPH|nr:aminotransferase class I/II-fold pyridoxal phosphate-dependent enzyme [Agrobacterium pusense]NRF07608.1 aminotransferase class I/II-fold pyridoxal phosphate-dependent enzyme [Agrobacterium pusense]NRF18340.1 aminotransferase class I/II-fold pyridoxal phosphate-dependent enzyme [Agrobacterium pusense]
MDRMSRKMSEAGVTPTRFENLPEYRRLMTHKAISAMAGVENPFYRSHEQAAGATTVIDGRQLINFASYDYVGANTHSKVKEAARAAIDRFGISSSASRLVAGERPLHAALEERLAQIYGTEASVCFVSGYLTNLALVSTLIGPRDLVIHDELIHNSVLAGIKLSGATRRFFRHNDPSDLEKVLSTIAGDFGRILVVVEGIYSMDGDIACLPELVKLRSRYGFWLMVDEAHSFGVLGATGRGTFEHFGIDPLSVDIWMGTLSKTAASCGGYIAGSRALIEILKAEAGGFVYSVGLAPVLAAAALSSITVLQENVERVASLRRNGHLFIELARQAGLNVGTSVGYSVVPVIIGDSLRAVQLSNDLFAAGINVLPIIHPAVQEGQARLRFFLTAEHTEEQIARTVRLTAEILGELVRRNVGLTAIDIQQVAGLIS